jgi:excinuclease ABC subunit C
MSLFSDLEEIPTEPGVYLIKDKEEKVIYVGKAKNLRNRVKQHFQTTVDRKEDKLQELANRVDWVITRSDSEALLLEMKLIKQLSPMLNSRLRDDKSNLLIRISMEEEYPQLSFARETDERIPRSVYFGPFPNNTMLKQTAKLVERLFPICNCGRKIKQVAKKGSSTRCMRDRLGRCLSPYKNELTREEYGKTVKNVISFLKGDVADLLDNIEEEMWTASQESNFEKAANLRDLIQAVRSILNIKDDLHSNQRNIDILGHHEEEGDLAISKLEVRNHRISNISNLIYSKEEEVQLKTTGEIVTLVYGEKKPEFSILVGSSFVERFIETEDINIRTFKTKIAKSLIDVAEKNARNEYNKYKRDLKYQEDFETVLEDMKSILRLDNAPQLIHGFDISTLMGEHSVGSCVVFENGVPQKKLYRRFKIRKTYSDPNDYAMMEEVIGRRYTSEALRNDPKPDLLIIDGGKGQLNIAIKVLEKVGLSIPIISIAKKNEEIFVEWSDDPIELDQSSSVLKLVQNVRDESHRFAINYHKLLRARRSRSSIFEMIRGIGKVKVQKLLREYKTLENIAAAEVEEVKQLLSINEEIANQIVSLAKTRIKKSPYED